MTPDRPIRCGPGLVPRRPVCDQDVRERVCGELGTTFLLEAGAGTGKTRVLVDRFVRCVLDGELGTGDVHSVAAITFTEKASGELRQRIREEFEERAAHATAGSNEAQIIEAALDTLDDAAISTIHGFAGRLLREYPVEAGVDPAFEQLDQLAADLERGRLWEEWLTELAVAGAHPPGPRDWLARLLRAGVRLSALRELAVGPRGVFGERYDIDAVGEPPGEPDLAAGLAGLVGELSHLRDYCGDACINQEDKGCCAALDLVAACERLADDPPGDLDTLAAELLKLPAKTTPTAPGGAKGNWDVALGGKDEMQERYRAVAAGVVELRDAYAGFLTGLALAVTDAFSRWAAATQLALGHLDFTDLLGCLRNLLANDRGARRALQQRFDYVLVDEFQDTDPLQAEIVFWLCEREPLASDWRQVVLRPGKLFVVGDPKQSIYRFRRADIGMFDEVRALIAGQPQGRGAVVSISQNFRTTPALVSLVNALFADVFNSDAAEGRQPSYHPVEPYRPHMPGARAAVLLGRPYGTAAGATNAARRDEAAALAALLIAMCGAAAPRWWVHDQDADRAAGESASGERWRPARWGDIALLYRSTTGLETLEDALREAAVPYRVNGGKTYFSRREVDDALLCLRAIDDPSDGPALYGALHSTLFGFSDDRLFRFWAAGGRFDLFAVEQPASHEPIVAALQVLRELHELRAGREVHELAAELLRRVHAAELLASTGAGQNKRSPTSRSWSTGRVLSRAPAAEASAPFSLGPARLATPARSRSPRSRTPGRSSTC